MKKIIPLLIVLKLNSFAQFTSNVALNTEVSTQNQYISGSISATTNAGKTYIAYFDGLIDLRVQLLDASGNKMFPATGISLVSSSAVVSYSDQVDIVSDQQENVFIAFANWANNGAVTLYKLNTQGTLLNTVSSLGNGSEPHMAWLPSGEIMLGWTDASLDTTYLQKISSTGSPVWSTPVKVPYSCKKIIPLANGNFYMVSYKYLHQVAGYATTFIQLMDANGTALWANPVCCSSNLNSVISASPVSCELGANQEIFIANTYFDSGVSGRRAYLQCVDVAGNLAWGPSGKVIINNPLLSYQKSVRLLTDPLTQNIFCLVNALANNSSASPKAKIYVQKFSSSGNTLFPSNGLQLTDDTKDPCLFGFERCGTDYVYSYISGIDATICASKFDNAGTIVWANNPLVLNSTSGFKSAVDAQLSIINGTQPIIVFSENRNGYVQVFAQNADCSGFIPNSIDELQNELNKASIYPNPVQNELVLSFINAVAKDSNSKLQVFNSTGELVLSQEVKIVVGENKLKLIVDQLPTGIYYMQLSSLAFKLVKL